MCRHLYRPLRVVKCNFDDDDDDGCDPNAYIDDNENDDDEVIISESNVSLPL